ncbi:MAG: serpin family protein [Eubacteriales bacterium]
MNKLLTSLLTTTLILGTLASCDQGESSITAENLMNSVQKSDIHVEMPQEGESQAKILEFYCDLLINIHEIESEGKENIMISPLSIATALSMTALGAQGETLTEMEEVFGLSKLEMASFLSVYNSELPSSDLAEFHLANSIWLKDDPSLTVHDSFLGDNKVYFDTDTFKAPFDSETLLEINQWVEINTNGMIDKVLEEIPEDAMLYLINALAFEGEWAEIYKESEVYQGTFTNLDGTKSEIEMMHSSETGYLEGDGFSGFSKSYKDDTYRFVGLLPEIGVSTEEIIAEINENPQKFIELLEDSNDYVDVVGIPKFKQEFSAKLSEPLQKMGMNAPFQEVTADFSRMATSEQGNLFISDVIHKTFIEVDERGTKAGAVTAVEISTESALMETKSVILDRPFVYFIVDTEQKLPLFMGIINQL